MKFDDHHCSIGKIRSDAFNTFQCHLYFSLIPAGSFSDDGKKHVTSYAVRLRKLQGIEKKIHPGYFMIENLPSLTLDLFRLSFHFGFDETYQRFGRCFWKRLCFLFCSGQKSFDPYWSSSRSWTFTIDYEIRLSGSYS